MRNRSEEPRQKSARLGHSRSWRLPNANPAEAFLTGLAYGQMLVEVLRLCGDDLTRENIMRQATSLKDFRNTALLPGSLINTSPTDYRVADKCRSADVCFAIFKRSALRHQKPDSGAGLWLLLGSDPFAYMANSVIAIGGGSLLSAPIERA